MVVTLAGSVAIAGAVVRVFVENGQLNLKGAISFVIAFAVVMGLIACYVGWEALAGNNRFTWVRTIAVNFAAIGGTNFARANLTEANLTGAVLKGTDFQGATLHHTCFLHTAKLNQSRCGNPNSSIIANQFVQYLLIQGKAPKNPSTRKKSYKRTNLRNAFLKGAKLQDINFSGADLSGANLQDADLSRAKFVQTQLDDTDLAGATLTGATIEDWGITISTKLEGIKCRYVFMRLPTKDNPNPRRKPDNWEEEFEDGDFADFIKPIVDTLDLYHNQRVDPRAIAISFKQLAENNPEAELEIVVMEKRGNDKLLLRAKTTSDSNHSQLNAEYFTHYNEIKALAEAEVQTLLAQKDSQISMLHNMVETALQRPNFYTNTQVEQVGIMTNNPGGISQSNAGSMGGGQQASIGNNNQQTISTQETSLKGEQLNKEEVLQMIGELHQMISSAEIPKEIKEEATTYLSATKKAVEKEEPNKERAKINLEGVAEELEKASKVATAGANLFTKAKPIIIKILSWLGSLATGSL